MPQTASVPALRKPRFRGSTAAVAFGLLVISADAALAQATGLEGVGGLFPGLIKGLLFLGLLGAVFYGVTISLVARAVGVEAGIFSGCLALVLAVLISVVIMIPLALILGADGSQAVWTVAGQVVGLVVTSWAIKKVLHTDWPRAVLTLLLAAILVSLVSAVALLVIF